MGGINIKLMQGIDETENQMQKEKQSPKTGGSKKMAGEPPNSKKTGEKSRTVREQQKTKKNTGMEKKDKNQPGRMPKKQVFSFRAVLADIAVWRAYAVASGKAMEDVCNDAMQEYLKRHKLSGVEQMIFDAIKVRDANGREQK